MITRRQMLAVASIAFATVSCRSLPFPDPHYEGVYGAALKKWTRSVTLYSGLETRAFVRVVWLSPDFVQSQAAEIARLRAELPDQAAQTLEKLREENRQPTFFAVAYFPDKTANDWNEADSVWRLALNLGLGEQAPQKIERFERPFNAELRALYPFLDEYSIAYRLQFPAPAQQQGLNGEAELIAAGAPGKLKFGWKADGSDSMSGGQGGPPDQPAPSPKP